MNNDKLAGPNVRILRCIHVCILDKHLYEPQNCGINIRKRKRNLDGEEWENRIREKSRKQEIKRGRTKKDDEILALTDKEIGAETKKLKKKVRCDLVRRNSHERQASEERISMKRKGKITQKDIDEVEEEKEGTKCRREKGKKAKKLR